jgi:hypothetical protein
MGVALYAARRTSRATTSVREAGAAPDFQNLR